MRITTAEATIEDLLLFGEDNIRREEGDRKESGMLFTESVLLTHIPSLEPSHEPTVEPTQELSVVPTRVPSMLPSVVPTSIVPSAVPSITPSILPSVRPSFRPTLLPTRLPTRSPTPLLPGNTLAPTIAPTIQIDPIITFGLAFTIQGVSSTTLSSNAIDAYLASVALVTRVPISYVTFVGYRVLSSSNHQIRRVLISTPSNNESFSMQLNSSVIFPLVNFPQFHGNTSVAYENVLYIISTSVSSQIFTKTFQQAARNYSSYEFLSSSVNSVTKSSSMTTISAPPVSSNDDDDDDGNPRLSDGAITGIVMGTTCGVLLIIVSIIYYYASYRHAHRRSGKIAALYYAPDE